MRICILVGILLVYSNVYAWENTITHKDISDAAVKLSLPPERRDSEYELSGKNQSLLEWVKDGAELEDSRSIYSPSTARYRNHFHNPLVNLTPPFGSLTQGGLTDMMTGQSALYWAQDGSNQSGFVEGDWSWQTIRTQYYRSLTATSKVGIEMFTAMTYLGLGYQMHLVQDMSQPDHVRNDAHPIDGDGRLWGFETWAKKKRPLIKQYATTATNATKPTVDLTQPLFDGYTPVGRLMDTRRYAEDRTPSPAINQGLAEYTNANFFSDNTIFAARYAQDDKHYFPYPRKEGTNIHKYFDGTLAPETMLSEDGKSVPGFWVSKIAEGETVPHLVRVGPLADAAYAILGEGKIFYDRLYRDEITYNDYASLLIPRAVGYSAALLDYFFRGKIEASLSTLNPSTSSTMRLMLKNATPGEEMTGGDLALVLRYHPYTESNSTIVPPPQDASFSYMVIKLQQQTVPSDTTSEFAFALPQTFPLWSRDLETQVVYQGPLGNESNAVAVSPWLSLTYTPQDIELKLPAAGVYAATTGTTTPFNEIRLNARNILPSGESMTDGTISLYVLYRTATADPFQSVPVTSLPADGYSLLKVSEKSLKRSLPTEAPVELIFDLTNTPLPLWATDVHLYAVYQGALSKDGLITSADARVYGMSDISEPTPVDVYNNTDYTCLNNTWYRYDDPAAMAIVDSNGNGIADRSDIYPHTISNIAFPGGPAGAGPLDASSANNLVTPGPLPPGQMQRLGYILTDYTNRYTFDETWTDLSDDDPWEALSTSTIFTGTGFSNQTGKGLNGMYNMRGRNMWWGTSVIFENNPYPADSYCDTDLLRQPAP